MIEDTAESVAAEPKHRASIVIVVTVGALVLSMINASIIGGAIAGVLIGLEWLDFSAFQSLEQKMNFVMKIEPVGIVAGVLGTSSALLILGVALVSKPRGRICTRLRLIKPRLFDVALVSIGMIGFTHALGQVIVFFGLDQTGSLADFNRMFESWSFEDRLRMLPVLAFCPGIAEEVFFRGYALSKLELAWGFKPAMFMTAVLFGLIHLDVVHSVAALGMGLYLAYAVRLTGSLWTTILAHILNNAMAVLFPDLIPEGLVIQILCFVIGLAICAFALVVLTHRYRDHDRSVVW